MALRIVEEAALSDVGRQRSANEDAYYSAAPVFAVADGMGGARAGEVASRMAVDAFGERREAIMGTSGEDAPERTLEATIKDANRRIFELARSDESYAGMGTTVTSMIVGSDDVAFGHVGDSRGYRMRDDELERLTEDHSLVEELKRQGRLTEEEAETHPQRSIITRAAGPEQEVEVDTFTVPAKPGDLYLLASDGLTGMLSEKRMAELLRGGASLASVARQLVDEANANGGRDNITVVLVRLGAHDAERPAIEDTLAGAETGLIDPAELQAARAEAPEAEGPRPDSTMIMSREEAAAAARAQGPPTRPPGRRRRRIGRKAVGAIVVLGILGALAVGLYAGSRQFYFVGTDDHGLVTLFRGLPYELPAGLDLFTVKYTTAVPARALSTPRRKELLDHELRSQGDATDLVRQIEDGKVR